MAHRLTTQATTPKLPPLRVLHRGVALVQDYSALMGLPGINRKIGAVFDKDLGPEIIEAGTPTGRRHGGFVKLVDEPTVIPAEDPYYSEYVRHLRDGDLWAYDQATADAAGVAFEPDFGGEHEKASAAEHCVAVLKARKEQSDKNTKAAKDLEAKLAKEKPPASPAPSAPPAPATGPTA